MSSKSTHDRLPVETIEAALSFIPADDRDVWYRMGMAVKSEFGESGLDIWDRWSQTSDSYNAKDAREVWKSLKAGGKISIGTLIYTAQSSGFDFDSRPHQISDEERTARKAQREADEARERADIERRQKRAAANAERLWEAASPIDCSLHPYLLRKQVTRPGGVRVGNYERWSPDGTIIIPDALLIPIRDAEKNLTSLQAIFPAKDGRLDRDRDYMAGAKKHGSYFTLGQPDGLAFICEGYATGCTIHDATGGFVVVAFDASNLVEVAKTVRAKLPDARIVIAADNDKWGKTNDGVKFAAQAAAAAGGSVILPKFKDESKKPTDFNDLAVLEGIDRVAVQLSEIFTPLASNDNQRETDEPSEAVRSDHGDEYFRILGHDRGLIYFFQYQKKQVVSMSPGSFTETGLLMLAPVMWWAINFPKQSSAFDKTGAVDYIIKAAYAVGIYDPTRVRGRGAWLDEGRVIFHFGSHVWVDGALVDITKIRSRYVYELARTLPGPADSPLTAEEGQRLQQMATMFRWTKPASAALLAGFVALAPLCGAMRWRPHVWITGGAGCGKTTVLNEYVHRLMGGMDIFAQGNSTEAGIRQRLGTDALPVLFDESEQNNEREAGRVQNVLSLIRQASSESAAMTLKGTAGGEAMQFMIRSMFCLSSIQVGIKHQADHERLTILALRPKREDIDAANTWRNLSEALYWLERDGTVAQRLFLRSLQLLPVTMQNIKTFIDAATIKFGSVREGDQYGTLLAGYWSLGSGDAVTIEQAMALIDSFEWEEYREALEMDESSKALAALMESKLDVPTKGRFSVFEVMRIAAGGFLPGFDMPRVEADALLQRHGMRVIGHQLMINTGSSALTKLLQGTPYEADIKGQLQRVKGVDRVKQSVRINGQVCRCLSVELSIFEDDPPPGALQW